MFNEFEYEGDMNIPNDPFQGLTKSKIYEIVSRDFVLPAKESRSISREYLIKVHQASIFRIRREQLLNFEATLSVEEQKKAPFFNVGYLLSRLNVLLQQQGMAPLGFTNNSQPDEPWFTRILRYLDRYNVLNGFKVKIRGSEPPLCLAGRMYHHFDLVL